MIRKTGGEIRKLPEHVINQIAAGEVIERPASVVKELVENSIDAGAVNVEVELEEGGKRSIRVIDDGLGIAKDQLPLALESHATSKLRSSDDLNGILTLGFRGEALASIASVAKVDVVSRPPNTDVGERIHTVDQAVCPGPPEMIRPGTRITVENLFYSVPARKRFLKSDRAELARVTTILQRIALALPDVGFSLTNGGRKVFAYPKGQQPEERVVEVLGEDCAGRLIRVQASDGSLHGWIAEPELCRRNSTSMHVYLNGRPLKDATIQHAIRHAYQGFQIPGKYPIAVVFLSVDPTEVDVNVHPAKLEVRFRDPGRIHSLVFHPIRQALEDAASVPPLIGESKPLEYRPPSGSTSRPSFPSAPASAPRRQTDRVDPEPERHRSVEPLQVQPTRGGDALVEGRDVRVFQVRNSFLVVEEEEGLTVIDQHALHEKILYEEICEAREKGELKQALLLPETVELTLEQMEWFGESRGALEDLGFEVDEFGDRQVIVRAVPLGFQDRSIPKLVHEALDRIGQRIAHGNKAPIELREALTATMACKRAVKAGQPLSRELQVDLLRGRARAFQPQNCPHGRPSELFLSWAELERRFDRK